MKKILVLILFVSFSFLLNAQENNFYDLSGKLLSKGEGKSINNINEEFFSDVEFIKVYHDNGKIKECTGYDIIYKKYTEIPLFILGKLPKEKDLKKCIDKSKSNVVSDYTSYQFKSDLDEMIKKNKSKEYVENVFGGPYKETLDKDIDSEITIFNYYKYYGTVVFDLIFTNGKLSRYIIQN